MIKRPFFILVAFFVYSIFSNFMSWYLLIIISLFLFLIYFLIYNLSKTEYRGLIIKSAYMLFTPLLVIAGAAFGKKPLQKRNLIWNL